jgi:hypothetical protein
MPSLAISFLGKEDIHPFLNKLWRSSDRSYKRFGHGLKDAAIAIPDPVATNL